MEKLVLTPEEKKEKARLRSAAWRKANPGKDGASGARYRANNKEKIKANRAARYEETREIVLSRSSAWAKLNRDKINAARRIFYKKNTKKAYDKSRKWAVANPSKIAEINARWLQNNPHVHAARVARRRAAANAATPGWASIVAINEIYADASLRSRETDVAWHVDHVIPLRSELVCGLHCEQNMQVLPAQENIIKGNRFWPGMP